MFRNRKRLSQKTKLAKMSQEDLKRRLNSNVLETIQEATHPNPRAPPQVNIKEREEAEANLSPE